jgi:amino acid adenylation domain-containing protein
VDTTSTRTRSLLPASRKEEALWLLDQLIPGSAANNLSVAFQVEGRLDVAALRHSLHVLLSRHGALRTVYRTSADGLVKTVLRADDVVLDVVPVTVAADALTDRVTAFVRQRFALDGSLLVRATVLRSAAGDVCCLAFHHLVFDTLSGIPLLTELAEGYEAALAGRPDDDAAEPAPYLTEPEPDAESVEFWRTHLAGFDPGGLDLACGRPDVDQPTLAGDQVTVAFADRTTGVLRRLVRELRAPEAVVLMSAYCLLLHAHGAAEDLTVGTPVNIRPPDAAGAIGYHVNMVPLRVRLDPAARVRDLVHAVRDVFFDALDHADVPVDAQSEIAPRGGHQWRGTVYRHVLNYVPDEVLPDFTVGGLPARSIVVENGHSKFDIEFFVLSGPDGVRLRAVYRTELFDRADIERMLARYEELLCALEPNADTPIGALEVWSTRDRDVVAAANDTADDERADTVPSAFLARANATPDAVALVDGDRVTTYGELLDAAHEVGRVLRAHGTHPGDVVAVAARRGADLVAAVFGCWFAGAAYLPVDPDHPADRLAYQLTDSGAGIVLTDDVAAIPPTAGTVLPIPDPTGPPVAAAPIVEPDDGTCAYLIYTSGSTGRPKGTLVTHRGLANVVAHFRDELAVTPRQAVLWLTTFAFDISALELFVPLVAGARVVVAPDEARTSGAALRAVLTAHPVDVIQATPTGWRLVLDQVADLLAGARVLCGGEAAPLPLARRLARTSGSLHHVYGPTETTIWSTSTILPADVTAPLSVGRPLRNTRVLVLGADDRELPIGVRGELCIAGHGVALGYHGRPDLTAARFGSHPVHGRFYRTGDIARWNDDGTLTLFGRGDRQVKLRGNRVELGEIEAVVAGHPAVRAAAVVVVPDDESLVAFVEADEDADLAGLADELWRRCRDALPRALVPQDFLAVPEFPTNANQKVDHPALVALAGLRRTGRVPGGSADTDDELSLRMMSLWRELLENSDVTADTNFFLSGGNSMLGAVLVQRVEAVTGASVRLADLFADPTPRALAARVRTARDAPVTGADQP